jgi:hypothetical protein
MALIKNKSFERVKVQILTIEQLIVILYLSFDEFKTNKSEFETNFNLSCMW